MNTILRCHNCSTPLDTDEELTCKHCIAAKQKDQVWTMTAAQIINRAQRLLKEVWPTATGHLYPMTTDRRHDIWVEVDAAQSNAIKGFVTIARQHLLRAEDLYQGWHYEQTR